MGVLDGLPVSAAITNPAFINKNQDDTMSNKLTLGRPFSGPTISDIQQAVNNLYTATGVSEIASGTAYNATPNTISNGDAYLVALTKLADKFDAATGHSHSGAAGDGPVISTVTTSVSATGNPPITGDVVLATGSNISYTQIGNTIFISSPNAVNSIAASGNMGLIGPVLLVAGGGVTLTQSGQNITIAASGGGGGGGTVPDVQILTGTGTYTTPGTPLYLEVIALGPGGGGSGSSSSSAGNGGTGVDTIFGPTGTPTMISAGAGNGAPFNSSPPAGGVYSVSSPAVEVIGVNGGYGGGCSQQQVLTGGGNGGSSALGGSGAGGSAAQNGFNASPNSGSGGGGASGGAGAAGQPGGAPGAYVIAIIPSPAASYDFVVGVGGAGGTAGTGGFAGGNGGNGKLVVKAHYE